MSSTVAQSGSLRSPEAEPIRLTAGPLAMQFDQGDLRYLRLANREVIRRIYGAVRDQDWGTVTGTISAVASEIAADRFHLAFTSTHQRGGIHFVWRAAITGEADGTVRFDFDGEARSTFLRNRIGLCVLHPIREGAGAKCRARYADGTGRELAFPEIIAAEQPISGFSNLAGLAHEIEPGVWAELEFTGDLFETEDQRNWTDASFKTYGTPLHLPLPVEITAGTRIRQSVALRLISSGKTLRSFAAGHPAAEPVVIRVHDSDGIRLPEIGLGMASHGRPLSGHEVDRLSRLGVSHLRADLRLAEAQWPARLRIAARDAMELGTALELAIHLPRNGPGNLAEVARELGRLKADLTRALIFRDGQRSTLAADLAAAREALGDCGVAIGAGTNADLYQLNLQRPPDDADFICWSMNPQVHASDTLSVAETPEAVVHQVASVHRYFPDLPLVVSPITLKPRFNPAVIGPEPPPAPGELPPSVDPRQLSPFAAAWTVAVLKALAEGDVESVTLFETTGWCGVMESEAGSPLPDVFPSTAGAVFPLYPVLADIGEFGRGRALPTETSDPQNVASLMLQSGRRRRLLLANLSDRPRWVSLTNFDEIVLARLLDGSASLATMNSPEPFRARRIPFSADELELPSHAVATLDFAER